MANKALAQGRTVVIFPEGRLNPHNLPIQAGTAAVRLSMATGVPIVPLGIYVPAEHTFPLKYRTGGQMHQGRWQTSGKCCIRVGAPWIPSQATSSKMNARSIHELTTQLMDKIYLLAEQACQESLQRPGEPVLEK
jgi:1-acyl-sn-glycerol-3-phosphate acyltransferase